VGRDIESHSTILPRDKHNVHWPTPTTCCFLSPFAHLIFSPSPAVSYHVYDLENITKMPLSDFIPRTEGAYPFPYTSPFDSKRGRCMEMGMCPPCEEWSLKVLTSGDAPRLLPALVVNWFASNWTSNTLKIRDSVPASLADNTMVQVLRAVAAPFDSEKTSSMVSSESSTSPSDACLSVCSLALLSSAFTSLSNRASSIRLLRLHDPLRWRQHDRQQLRSSQYLFVATKTSRRALRHAALPVPDNYIFLWWNVFAYRWAADNFGLCLNFDVNRSTTDEVMSGKYIFASSDLDLWPLDLKSAPLLLLSNATFPLNYKFLRLSRFEKIGDVRRMDGRTDVSKTYRFV